MKTCVVCVGSGRYVQGVNRLEEELRKFDVGPDHFFRPWRSIPAYWPSHEQVQYAFKAYALMAAWHDTGADLLLWADAAVMPIRSMKPLWDKIERDGYFLAINGWTNYEWTADSAYPDLFPGIPIEEAREINKTFPQVVATSFGVNMAHPIGRKFFDEYYRLASETRAFCGPWGNTNSTKGWKYHESMMGPCGGEEVLGHRHDQTAASVLAWRLKMELSQCPEWFAYPPAAGNTILLAVGA